MPKDRLRTTVAAKSLVCPYPVVSAMGSVSEWTSDSTNQSSDGEQASSIAIVSESVPASHRDSHRDNETNLIVNYLPSSMTQDDIRVLFCSLGELESCKLIRDKVSGQSLGYGFVKYKRPSDAKRAISSLNGLRLQNKTIKVSLARPSSDTIKGANLYISGLSKTMTSHDLQKLFSPFGDIITARVLCDAQTGFSKGVGFIRYNLKSQAEQAIKELNGSTPPSGAREPITVKFANQPTVNKPVVILPQTLTTAICPQPVAVYPQNGQIVGAYSTATTRLRHPNKTDHSGALPLTSAPSTGGWTLLVSNLTPGVDESVLWSLFVPFGTVQGVSVVRDPSTNKCKGFGFVSMSGQDEAILAVAALNGQQLDGHVIQVSFWKGPSIIAPPPSATVVARTHPGGYGIIPGGGILTNIAVPDGNLEVFRLRNSSVGATLGGLQLVGYPAGMPRAVTMATVADCGLTALPMM